jgi:hypothetical protein
MKKMLMAAGTALAATLLCLGGQLPSANAAHDTGLGTVPHLVKLGNPPINSKVRGPVPVPAPPGNRYPVRVTGKAGPETSCPSGYGYLEDGYGQSTGYYITDNGLNNRLTTNSGEGTCYIFTNCTDDYCWVEDTAGDCISYDGNPGYNEEVTSSCNENTYKFWDPVEDTDCNDTYSLFSLYKYDETGDFYLAQAESFNPDVYITVEEAEGSYTCTATNVWGYYSN